MLIASFDLFLYVLYYTHSILLKFGGLLPRHFCFQIVYYISTVRRKILRAAANDTAGQRLRIVGGVRRRISTLHQIR